LPINADCDLHPTVKVWHPELVNLYGCQIEADCNIGAFVEIGCGVTIGKGCRVGAHSFIPEGVTVGNNVFIGPGVRFANDKHPPSGRETWKALHTVVEDKVSIGMNATILPGVKLGRGCMIGAGAVVTKDVPEGATWVGIPAQELKRPDGYSSRA
jgi:UDP-2-acetamido-3-amino-2,3-dideoxy-glucuronate N-acetyltransferase